MRLIRLVIKEKQNVIKRESIFEGVLFLCIRLDKDSLGKFIIHKIFNPLLSHTGFMRHNLIIKNICEVQKLFHPLGSFRLHRPDRPEAFAIHHYWKNLNFRFGKSYGEPPTVYTTCYKFYWLSPSKKRSL